MKSKQRKVVSVHISIQDGGHEKFGPLNRGGFYQALVGPRSLIVSEKCCYAGDPGSIPKSRQKSCEGVETLGSVSISDSLTSHQGVKLVPALCGSKDRKWMNALLRWDVE